MLIIGDYQNIKYGSKEEEGKSVWAVRVWVLIERCNHPTYDTVMKHRVLRGRSGFKAVFGHITPQRQKNSVRFPL